MAASPNVGTDRAALLIAGMHRSGTSAFTRVLSNLGGSLPEHVVGPNPSNAAGHWEPERLVSIHDQMLSEGGSRWDDWRQFDPNSLGNERLAHFRTVLTSIIEHEYGS